MLVCADNRELCMFRDCDNCAKYFEHEVKNNIIDKERIIKMDIVVNFYNTTH